ncbi:hypothetical protein [Roseobacter sp. HKCCA0434]|uniref:hypothetical protein n=1 Tax=Roseobacter sp. HKCCA0434 TaxID=3079297 RepID=UPI002905A611|nr:hypothetical protein [Roseobacter sp. HKCCA0434]
MSKFYTIRVGAVALISAFVLAACEPTPTAVVDPQPVGDDVEDAADAASVTGASTGVTN